MQRILSLICIAALSLLGACHDSGGGHSNPPPQDVTRVFSPQIEIGKAQTLPDRLLHFGARKSVSGQDQILAGCTFHFEHIGMNPPSDPFDQVNLTPSETVASWDPCGRIGQWRITLTGDDVTGTPTLEFEVIATTDQSAQAQVYAQFDVFMTKYETWQHKTFEMGDNQGHVVGTVYILDQNLEVLAELPYDGTNPSWLLTSQYNDDMQYSMGVETTGLKRASALRPFFILGPQADVGVYVDGYGGHVNSPIDGRIVADPPISDFTSVYIYLDYVDQAFSDFTRVNAATGDFKLQPTRTGCARWRVADVDGNNIFVGGFEYWNQPYSGIQIVQQ